MKFVLNQSHLAKMLQVANTLSRSTTQMPILGNIHLATQDKNLIVKATDLTSGISISAAVSGADEGSVLVPSGQFLEYIQALGAGDVTVGVEGAGVRVNQGSSSATFPAVDSAEYPDFVPPASDGGAKVALDELQNCIKAVAVAVAQDESRPQLTGFLFKRKEGEQAMHLVGTDGYRLAMAEIVFEGELERDLLVPAKPLLNLLKGWEGKHLLLGFDRKNNQAWLKGEGRVGVVRLLQGDFPDFGKIIPQSYTAKVVVGKEDMLQAVTQLSVFARQNANIIQVAIDKTIKMTTQSGMMGSGSAELEVAFEGEPITVVFNYRYLREYLLSVPDGMLTLVFNGPLAPVKITSEASPTLIHIIMPVKL